VKNSLDLFRSHTPIQVRWADLDPLNHVNNSSYFQYFEHARGKYMLDASPSWDWSQHMFLVASIQCQYLQELKFNDPQPQVWVRTQKLGTKSFEVEYVLISRKGTEAPVIHATGQSTQVMFDTATRSTIAIPDWMRQEILAFEKEGSIHM
jgi:acyl-CoA thioester hydrolase